MSGERFAYTVKEAAELLAVHPSWIRRALADGLLRSVQRRPGGKVLVTAESLRRLVDGEES